MNKRRLETVVFLKFPECVSLTRLPAGWKEVRKRFVCISGLLVVNTHKFIFEGTLKEVFSGLQLLTVTLPAKASVLTLTSP